MSKDSGFDGLSRQLDEARQALSSIDGELGTITFDPNDPGAIEAAIQQMETILDERLASYSANPIVGPLLVGLKEKYREGIIERAAAARLEEDPENAL